MYVCEGRGESLSNFIAARASDTSRVPDAVRLIGFSDMVIALFPGDPDDRECV